MAIRFLNALNIDGTVTATINADANAGYDGILVSTSGLIERRTKAEILSDIGAGTMTSFTVAADTNTATTTISDSDTLSILGGTGVSTVSNPDGTITINASGSSYTKWVLAGDSGTAQDVNDGDTATYNGVNGIVTETKANRILEIGFPIASLTSATVAGGDLIAIADVNDSNNIKSVTAQSIADLAPQGDITAVEKSTAASEAGIKVTSGTGPIPKIGVDIIGQANIGAGNLADDDEFLVHDDTATQNLAVTFKTLKDQIQSGIAGDITSVIPSTADAKLGITIANQTGPIPEVGVDIAGQTSLGTGADGDLLLIYDLDTTKNKQIALSALKTYIGAITSISSGSGIKVTTVGAAATVAVDYTSTGIIADANNGASVTIADGDLLLLQDINATSASTATVYVTASQLKTYIGADNYGSWTLSDGTTTQTIGSNNTVLVQPDSADGREGIEVAVSATDTLTIGLNLDLLDLQTTVDEANDELVFVNNADTKNEKIVVNNIHLSQWGKAEADVNMGSSGSEFRIKHLKAGSDDTDAVNVGQLNSAVSGVGLFQGGYNANTGLTTDLSTNGSLDGASNIALDKGDFFVVTVDGTAFYGVTLEVGDMIYANQNITASSDPNQSVYTVVRQDANIAGVGATDGATEKGVSGFDSAIFTATSNGWIQLIDQSITEQTYGGASKSLSINFDKYGVAQSAAEQDIDITASQVSDFCTAVSTCIASNEQYTASIGNNSATSIAVTHNLGTRDVMVQLYDNTNFDTVYADVVRTSTSVVTVDFTTAPATAGIRILITKVS